MNSSVTIFIISSIHGNLFQISSRHMLLKFSLPFVIISKNMLNHCTYNSTARAAPCDLSHVVLYLYNFIYSPKLFHNNFREE